MTDTTADTTAERETSPSGSHSVLVTGATGYVGGKLVPALLERGWRVRVLSRHPENLPEAWRERVEAVEGDASEPADIAAALEGADVAYYLLHSMGAGKDWRAKDLAMARTFAAAAKDAGTSRIVYLSGLHPDGVDLSNHMASRTEVGEAFLDSGVPTAVLQAGVVLGEGSVSYRMLRHLTERLPIAVGPRWLRNEIQPIAVRDVVHYLLAAADLDASVSRTFDIGMEERLSYLEMMRRYAAAESLGPRVVGTVPVLTPKLASYWVGLVTPVESGVARPLVESLLHEAVVDEDDARTVLGEPEGGLLGYEEALARAGEDVDSHLWRRTLGRTSAAVLAAAVIGSLLTDPQNRWYKSLRKPSIQPPALAFPIVWTALYAVIAIASASGIADLVEEDREDEARAFARALGVNLVLNAGWTGLFFRGHSTRAATLGAAALAVSSIDLARRGAKTGAVKAVGLGAYAAWCSFATVLSGAIARLNPGT